MARVGVAERCGVAREGVDRVGVARVGVVERAGLGVARDGVGVARDGVDRVGVARDGVVERAGAGVAREGVADRVGTARDGALGAVDRVDGREGAGAAAAPLPRLGTPTPPRCIGAGVDRVTGDDGRSGCVVGRARVVAGALRVGGAVEVDGAARVERAASEGRAAGAVPPRVAGGEVRTGGTVPRASPAAGVLRVEAGGVVRVLGVVPRVDAGGIVRGTAVLPRVLGTVPRLLSGEVARAGGVARAAGARAVPCEGRAPGVVADVPRTGVTPGALTPGVLRGTAVADAGRRAGDCIAAVPLRGTAYPRSPTLRTTPGGSL